MAILNYESIRYQSETKLLELAVEISESSSLKKARLKIYKASKIRYFLKAINSASEVIESTKLNSIYQCLQHTAEITSFPTVPEIGVTTVPAILIGLQGADGADGADGAQGVPGPTGPSGTGSVTLTYTNINSTSLVLDTVTNDPLEGTNSIGVRWDIFAQRQDASPSPMVVGYVIGFRNNAGSVDYFSNVSTILTSSVAFQAVASGDGLDLITTRDTGTQFWQIHVKRYMISDFALV